MTKKTALIGAMMISIWSLQAQQLHLPINKFSSNKEAYVTLISGVEINGKISIVEIKKGLIDFIEIEDGKGQRRTLKSEEIKHAYLYPEKPLSLEAAADNPCDLSDCSGTGLDQGLISEGYVYFERVKVMVGKKKMFLLLQLANPDFDKKVKVYHSTCEATTDEFGLAKSYFVKLEYDPFGSKLEKKKYEVKSSMLWGRCSSLHSFKEKAWKDFVNHVIYYTRC